LEPQYEGSDLLDKGIPRCLIVNICVALDASKGSVKTSRMREQFIFFLEIFYFEILFLCCEGKIGGTPPTLYTPLVLFALTHSLILPGLYIYTAMSEGGIL
jgi:hypothetical protein